MTVQVLGIQPKTPAASKNNVQFYWRYVPNQTPPFQPCFQADGVEYALPFAQTTGGLVIASGSWTPGMQGSGTAGSYTNNTSTCTYFRIGSLVTITASLNFTQVSAGAGDVVITGLPFTANEAFIMIPYVEGYTLGAGFTHMLGLFGQGTTTMSLQKVDNSGYTNTNVDDIGTDILLSFSGSYVTPDV